jgi:hypothetical protein
MVDDARRLVTMADALVKKSVWIIGDLNMENRFKMAGADVTILCPVLMRPGLDRLRVIEEEMANGCASTNMSPWNSLRAA